MLRAVIIRSLLVVLGLMAAFGVVLYFVQDGMIYMPRAYRQKEVRGLESQGLKQIESETGEGRQVAFYKPHSAGGTPERIWLVFAGNGGRGADYRSVAGEPECGYLFFDSPGYGLCEGKPDPKNIDAAVDAAITAIGKDLEMGSEECEGRLCVLGHSLGGAVALRAALRHEIDRVVLLAPFTTMRDMAAMVVGDLYANVLRHRFDNLEAMAALQQANPGVRVKILNGTQDREIPAAMGRDLAQRFPEISSYQSLEGAGHNDILDRHLQEVLQAMQPET